MIFGLSERELTEVWDRFGRSSHRISAEQAEEERLFDQFCATRPPPEVDILSRDGEGWWNELDGYIRANWSLSHRPPEYR